MKRLLFSLLLLAACSHGGPGRVPAAEIAELSLDDAKARLAEDRRALAEIDDHPRPDLEGRRALLIREQALLEARLKELDAN